MAMIQARREAGSRCGRKSARPAVATSAAKIAAELTASQSILPLPHIAARLSSFSRG
jgi:hypothetical protein